MQVQRRGIAHALTACDEAGYRLTSPPVSVSAALAGSIVLATLGFAPAPESVAPGPPPERREVVVETDPDGLASQRAFDRRHPGFGTVVELRRDMGARPADALPEVLARTPGVTIRSIGGLGQFTSISLRGSSAQQVPIFMDGAPIGDALAGLVDLGSIPLDTLERVEVYRGHVPVSFGAAAIGGAVNLVSVSSGSRGAPAYPRATGHVGVGSFASGDARAEVVVPTPAVTVSVRAGYAASRGDFPFYDQNRTPEISADDRTSKRDNNGYRRLLGQIRAEGTKGRLRWSIQELTTWKHQEIPGPAQAQSDEANLRTLDARVITNLGRDRLGRRDDGSNVEWVASVGVQRRHFADPNGEIGLAVDDQRTLAVDTFVSPRLRVRLWRGAFLRLVADQRNQYVSVQQAVDPQPGTRSGDADRFRAWWGAGAELEQFLAGDRILLVPALRFDAIDSRFAVGGDQGEQNDQGEDHLEFGFSPRLGTRFVLTRGLELRATAGRYFRPPTVMELFGDRGYARPNEALRPERGTSVDGGLVADWTMRNLGVYAQAVGFWIGTSDLIQWVQAGPVTRATNLSAARVAGIETAVSIDAFERLLVVQANYTFQDSENRTTEPEQRGKPLPGRPRHELFARASTGAELSRLAIQLEPRVFYTFEVVSGTFLDPSARLGLPPRLIHGLGLELHVARMAHFAFEIRNLLDTRVTQWTPPSGNSGPIPVPISDFIGYPLPGRSLWASLTIDLAFRARARGKSR